MRNFLFGRRLSIVLSFALGVSLAAPGLLAGDGVAETGRLDNDLERSSLDLTELTNLTAASLAQGEGGGEAADWASGWSLGGYVDIGYTWNGNGPSSNINYNRIFDGRHNNFDLHQAVLIATRAPEMETPVGVELKVTAGLDVSGSRTGTTLSSAGLNSGFDNGLASGDAFDLTAANIQIMIPGDVPGLSGGIFKIGKFETTIGYEYLASGDSDQYSRSFMFGLGIPFTHTGILFKNDVEIGEDLAVGYNVGVVNGWDNTDDSNDSKSYMAGFSIDAMNIVFFSVNGILGAEDAGGVGNDSDNRGLLDFVLTVNVPDTGLSFGANVDYAADETNVGTTRYQKWYAVAGYTKYDLGDVDNEILKMFYFAGRAEVFWDPDQFRSQALPAAVPAGTIADRFYALTATMGIRPWDNLLFRLEYRFDKADADVYDKSTSGTGVRSSMSTIAANAVLSF